MLENIQENIQKNIDTDTVEVKETKQTLETQKTEAEKIIRYKTFCKS